MPGTPESKAAAKAFVAEQRRVLHCAQCGSQPVEWHNFTHADGRENYRIAHMAARGVSLALIQAEMNACTPLCRSCHMLLDGRSGARRKPARAPTVTNPKTCANCGVSCNRTWRGMCQHCYDRTR